MQPIQTIIPSIWGFILLTLLLLPMVIALGLACRQKFLEWYRGAGSQRVGTK